MLLKKLIKWGRNDKVVWYICLRELSKSSSLVSHIDWFLNTPPQLYDIKLPSSFIWISKKRHSFYGRIFIKIYTNIQSALSYSGCSNRLHPDKMLYSLFLWCFFIIMSFTFRCFCSGRTSVCWIQEVSKTDKDSSWTQILPEAIASIFIIKLLFSLQKFRFRYN